MGSRLVKQLWILLVKNFRTKINTFLYTSFEIIGPLIYAAMLYYNILGSRQEISRDPPTSIEFDEYSLYKHGYILGYAPANAITDELMFRAARLANQKYNTDLEAIGFDSEYHMVDFVREHPENIHSVYAFANMTSRTTQLPETLHLILRPIIDFEGRNKIPTAFKYDLHAMQVIMESYIYQHTGREHKLNVTWSNRSKLTTLHQSTPALIQTISILYCLLLGFLICRNVYCIAHERESGVLKLLSQTGVNMFMYWLSWFITVFVIFWLTALVIGAMMFVKYNNTPPVFIKSDIYAVLLYFTLFAVACAFYCITGSVICHKADTASIISTCFFLGSSFPLQIMDRNEVGIFLACFLVNKNVHLTLMSIHRLEHKGHGFSFSSTQIILITYISVIICSLVYAVMARILYNCVINRRPLWMILPVWKYKKSKLFKDSNQTMVMSEESLSHLKSGVIIDKLCANIPAPLGEINFTIYQNLVTVITDLDGNSSTTFLSILTGENQPLKGSVQVGNLDIVKNIAKVKQLTSLCPKEQTALFDSFTVLENLQFFHEIKSACQGHREESRLQEVIDMFELNRHLRTSVDSLSSAEKRLLQIAIVYLGKSKMLLFDCPTLDMDPYTKSKSWNVIRRNTQDTIVIVCTESIEEAEMVGDMIAVVSGGLMRSYGTIEYIYFMYGIGYKLVIDKTATFDYDRVEMIVTEMINNVKIVDDTTTRLVFLLPMEAASIFYHLLTFLENHKHTLGIVRFSVNTVSLEEAILEKSTEVALLELNEKHSAEFAISTPKKYEMLCTALQESYVAESNVDRPQASSSKTDAERVPTKSDVRNNLAEELQVIRYTGCRLALSQIEALFKKKIILSVCSFHLEIVQVIFLVMLATCECNDPIDLDTKETNKNPRNLNQTSVRVASLDGNFTASSHLVQRYMDLFLNSNITSVKELASDKLLHHTNTEDDLQIYDMIGASFHVDNISNVYESVAVHSTCGRKAEDLFLPQSITAVMNAFLRYFNQSNRYYIYASILPERHSIHDLNTVLKNVMRSVRIYRNHFSFMQSMAFLLVPYFAVLERTTGFKHLQHLSGVGSVMYWAVSLVSDLTTYLFLALLYPVIAALFETEETIARVESIQLMMMASGVVMLLYIYVLQFAFSVPASAAFIICLLNYFMADAVTIVHVLFGKQGQFRDNLYDEMTLALPPCIFPYFIFRTTEKNRYYKLCQINSGYCHDMDPMIAEHCCKVRCVDPQCTKKQFTLVDQDTGIDSEISIALAVHLVFWTTMLLLIEYRIIHKIRPTADCCAQMVLKVCRRNVTQRKSITKRRTVNIQSLFNRHKAIYRVPSQTIGVDSGITDELKKLQETTDDVGLIRIVGVNNTDSYIAGLTRLNFLICNGESYCFVDMDKSRASKILKLLSGMKAPASGKIIVKGKPFKIGGKPSFTPIGYCTEMNAVLGALTGREVLTIHAKLRGIPDENLSNVVDSALKKFNILDKADNHSGNYNSSDKRLLNIAVAVIGDPEIILLDDPFGNLDVVNKSLVWQTLDKSMLLGSTVIMCSDKIREVSDNVTVLAILLDGEPVCVGSPEIVRDRYCCSYTLLAKLDVSNRNLPIESLISSMQERFPKSVIFYDHQDFLHMRIPYDDATLPDVFALMESAKKHLKIQSYKLVHTNLSYVITAIQQRVVEESTSMNERDDDDEEDPKT